MTVKNRKTGKKGNTCSFPSDAGKVRMERPANNPSRENAVPNPTLELWANRVCRGEHAGVSLEIDEERCDVRGADPADPPRLAERARADPQELLARLGTELWDGRVVEVLR